MSHLNIALDIETIGIPPSEEDIEAFKADLSPPGNYKTEAAISKWWSTEASKKVDAFIAKRALELGGAQIVSVGLACVGRQELTCLDAFCSPDEDKVIAWVVEELNDFGAPFRLVTFNGDDFDLPQLALKIAKHKLNLEHPLGKFDSLDLFRRPFNRSFGLKKLSAIFGIERNPLLADIDGSSVSSLFEEGKYDLIREYNLDDVRITAELFQALSRTYNL